MGTCRTEGRRYIAHPNPRQYTSGIDQLLPRPAWLPDLSIFTFLDNSSPGPLLWLFEGARPSVLISVEELKLHPVSIAETYPTGALDYHTSEFRQSERLKVRGTAELVGQDIRFRGHLSTKIESTCA